MSGVKSNNIQKIGIPYEASIPNLAWEICALYVSKGFWIHILWVALDLVIFIINYRFIRTEKNKDYYLFATALITCFFFFIFKLSNGMLISSFIIDLSMSVFYLVRFGKISPCFKIPVAVAKLLGDVFAGIHYFKELKWLAFVPVLVFACNSIYLILSIKEIVILRKRIKTTAKDEE